MKVKTTDDSTSPERERRATGRIIEGFRLWGSWLIFLLLCGHLIFSHGCHGEDVDDELCVPLPVREIRNAKSEIRKNPQTLILKTPNFSPSF
jgi:hypothetical protein